MRLPLASTLLLFLCPMVVLAQTPGPPMGLYDMVIQTNCIDVPEQMNLDRPNWEIRPVPVFAPGQAPMHLRTVNTTEYVRLFSSNPAALQVPARLQLATGGRDYNRTTSQVTLRELSKPTNVTVRAVSGFPERTRTWDVTVLPRYYVSNFRLTPAKAVYKDGDKVTARIDLPWGTRISVVDGVFGRPVLVNPPSGVPEDLTMTPWSGNEEIVKRQQPDLNRVTLDFTIRIPDRPDSVREALAMQKQLEFRMEASIRSFSLGCNLVKNPTAKQLTFKVENPHYTGCPTGQVSVTSKTIPACSACVTPGTRKLRGPADCAVGKIFVDGYCIDDCRPADRPERPEADPPPGTFRRARPRPQPK